MAQHLDAPVRLRDHIHAGVGPLELRRQLVEGDDEAARVHEMELLRVVVAAGGQEERQTEHRRGDEEPRCAHRTRTTIRTMPPGISSSVKPAPTRRNG